MPSAIIADDERLMRDQLRLRLSAPQRRCQPEERQVRVGRLTCGWRCWMLRPGCWRWG